MPRVSARRLVSTIERAYDFDERSHAWLQGLLSHLTDALAPAGSIVMEYDSGGPLASLFVDWAALGVLPGEEAWLSWALGRPEFRAAATACLRPLDRLPPAARLSELMGLSLGSSPFQHFASRYGFADVLMLNAGDGTHRGVFFGLQSSTRSGREFERARAVLPHVTAALRIRRGLAAEAATPSVLQGAPYGAEAVLDVDGLVRDGALAPTDRQRLRHAVLERDRLRLAGTDPEETLDAWSALIDGRWSLVDVFEGSGKRWVVAVPNLPNVRDPRALPPMERAVFGLLVRGRSNKCIAFDLGISEGTAAGYVRDIRRKLGVETLRAAAGSGTSRTLRVNLGPANLMAIASDRLGARGAGDSLTATEQRVIEQVLSGKTNQEVASERRVSASTVAKQIASAYEKLGVGSRRELRAKLQG